MLRRRQQRKMWPKTLAKSSGKRGVVIFKSNIKMHTSDSYHNIYYGQKFNSHRSFADDKFGIKKIMKESKYQKQQETKYADN